jgi:hypothetical protein
MARIHDSIFAVNDGHAISFCHCYTYLEMKLLQIRSIVEPSDVFFAIRQEIQGFLGLGGLGYVAIRLSPSIPIQHDVTSVFMK